MSEDTCRTDECMTPWGRRAGVICESLAHTVTKLPKTGLRLSHGLTVRNLLHSFFGFIASNSLEVWCSSRLHVNESTQLRDTSMRMFDSELQQNVFLVNVTFTIPLRLTLNAVRPTQGFSHTHAMFMLVCGGLSGAQPPSREDHTTVLRVSVRLEIQSPTPQKHAR